MGLTADQYQDRPARVLFCFDISRYAAYFDFLGQKTPIRGQNLLILQLFHSFFSQKVLQQVVQISIC